MGRYPFTECVNNYIPTERGHISKETLETTRRRLLQIGRIFHQLKEDGEVSTDNPRKITPRDIDVFVGHRKMNGLKPGTLLKDLGCLSKMLVYYDNEAVVKFRAKYSAHVPKKYQLLQESMEESRVRKIIDRANEVSVSNWKMVQAYGLVMLAICTGLRPKELRMMYASNVHIDGNDAEVFVEHVKGEGKYGRPRPVSVHPDGVPILKKYMEARALKLKQLGKRNDALFPPLQTDSKFLSYNRIRMMKTFVEEDIGEKFDLRECRRTFGQRALNEGQDIYNVSRVMGHSSLVTTQRYYCDKELHVASREMKEFWSKNRKQEASEEDS
jgi:Site-specific recombinase XerD